MPTKKSLRKSNKSEKAENSFEKIVADIKSLKIQGAQNVAKQAVIALKEILIKSKAKTTRELYSDLSNAKKILFETRPTEPAMRNAINYVLFNTQKRSEIDMIQEVSDRISHVLGRFESSEKKIAEIGANKIKNGYIVFTHCHSSTVVEILKLAKKQGKEFKVYNTETRPLFQGRKTATELAHAGIEVHHFIDSAARIAIKEADLALFGCDAITNDRLFNKIGTELFCEVAKKYDVPVYFCTDSWKFDPKSLVGFDEVIEERSPDEVWKDAPKKVTVVNLAFEKIDPLLLNGIITEFGIYPHSLLIEELEERYPWMF